MKILQYATVFGTLFCLMGSIAGAQAQENPPGSFAGAGNNMDQYSEGMSANMGPSGGPIPGSPLAGDNSYATIGANGLGNNGPLQLPFIPRQADILLFKRVMLERDIAANLEDLRNNFLLGDGVTSPPTPDSLDQSVDANVIREQMLRREYQNYGIPFPDTDNLPTIDYALMRVDPTFFDRGGTVDERTGKINYPQERSPTDVALERHNLQYVGQTENEIFFIDNTTGEPVIGDRSAGTLRSPEPDFPLVGERGDRGEKGERGDRGEKGERGDRGPEGQRGLAGINGQDGAEGPRGEPGQRGERGLAGIDGQDGQDGADGADGADGERGPQGERGLQGLQGEPGALSAEQIANINERINAGSSTAAALTALPTIVPEGRTFIVGLGAGHFGGDTALSFGGAGRITQPASEFDIFFNVGGARSLSSDHYSVKGGISVAW